MSPCSSLIIFATTHFYLANIFRNDTLIFLARSFSVSQAFAFNNSSSSENFQQADNMANFSTEQFQQILAVIAGNQKGGSFTQCTARFKAKEMLLQSKSSWQEDLFQEFNLHIT